jgi:hypothetical protein
VVITEAGRQAIADAAPGHVAAVRDLVIDVLDPEQLRVLAEAGEAVAARLTAVNCRAEAELGVDESSACANAMDDVSTSS